MNTPNSIKLSDSVLFHQKHLLFLIIVAGKEILLIKWSSSGVLNQLIFFIKYYCAF